MKKAILQMAGAKGQKSEVSDKVSLSTMGENARANILSLAEATRSTDRVMMAMQCAIENRDNPFAKEDLDKSLQTAEYLDQHQWGHSLEEQLWLHGMDAKVRLLRWQRKLRDRLAIRTR